MASNPPPVLDVWRVQIEVRGAASVVGIRKRGDLRALWHVIEGWIYKAKNDGGCEALTIVLHRPTCDHEDPT